MYFCFAKFGLRRGVVQALPVESPVKVDLEYHDEQDWGDRGQPQVRLEAVLEADGCNSVNDDLRL